MKIKTSNLTGPALDWAVAKLQKADVLTCATGEPTTALEFLSLHDVGWANYSTDWSQGGPIIERERIELCSYSNDGVDTAFREKADEKGNYSHEEEYVISVPEVVTWTAWVKYGSNKQDGPTPLIAAMRCFVASKLGDTVEVPDELIGKPPTQ